MEAKFEQFIQERKYLTNVSPRTIEWYTQSLNWLGVAQPTDTDLKACVMRMRQAGLKPTSCNNRIRAINAYLKWSGSPLKVTKMQEPQLVLPTFTPEDIKRFMAYKPKSKSASRLQVLVLLLADTGVRINEALNLRWTDVDFDNMLVKVFGKGGKERMVPFSFELRRFLWKFRNETKWVFSTRTGNQLGRRTVNRDVKHLCEKVGVKVPMRTLHAFRHSFALNYVKKGGNVFFLQRILGHSTLEMSRKYVNLCTADLQAVHQERSMLS